EAYIKASNTGEGDQFGYSVSLSGDTIAVGAYGEASAATGVNGDQGDNSAGSRGAVYVFKRTVSVWTQEAYLKATNTGTFNFFDSFGISVSLSGDTLAVGSGNAVVYMFKRSSGVWAQEAFVQNSYADLDTGGMERFGHSV